MNAAQSRCIAATVLVTFTIVGHAAEPTSAGSMKAKAAEKWAVLSPCAKGAIAGAAAGQVLGKRPIVGALAGCGTAHYVSGKKEAEARAQRESEAAKEAQAAKDAPAAEAKPSAADPGTPQVSDQPKGDRPD